MANEDFREERFTFKPGDAVMSACITCYWKSRFGPTCAAFPQMIPADILNGDNRHVDPVDGDHGIQYHRDPTLDGEEILR